MTEAGTRGRSMTAPLGACLRVVAAALRGVLGAPDYGRYLAHMREHHAGESPLGHAEYVRQRLEARYSRPGARCC